MSISSPLPSSSSSSSSLLLVSNSTNGSVDNVHTNGTTACDDLERRLNALKKSSAPSFEQRTKSDADHEPPPAYLTEYRAPPEHSQRDADDSGFDGEFVEEYLSNGGGGGGSNSRGAMQPFDLDNDSDTLLRAFDRESKRKRRIKNALNCLSVSLSMLVCLVGVALVATDWATRAYSAANASVSSPNAQWHLLAQAFRNDSNTSVDPCVDFYEYACGGMLARTTLAPDQSSEGLFYELRNTVQQRLLEVAEAGWPVVTAWFDACEDTHTRDLYSDELLTSLLELVDTINDTASAVYALAALQPLGVHAVFDFGATVDPLNNTRYVYWLGPAEFSLPHDMMLGTDDLSRQAQQATRVYIGELLTLAGYDGDAVDGDAVFAFEQALARTAQSPEQYRASSGVAVETSVGALNEVLGTRSSASGFDWLVYYGALSMRTMGLYVMANASRTMHADGSGPLVVDRSLVSALPVLLSDANAVRDSIALWLNSSVQLAQAYMRYRFLSSLAGDASTQYVAARNRFANAINGLAATPPLWSQCISSATAALGDLFAHYYVQQFFSDRNRHAAEALVARVEQAMLERLTRNRWMDQATRQAALQKLAAIHAMVGSPAQWSPDVGFDVYSSREGGIHLVNVLSWRKAVACSSLVAVLLQMAPERYPWLMYAFDVNAYYSENSNDIALPAGILQGFFFDVDAPLSVNYGSLGAVIGHELTHGFDDQGRLYDAGGNLRDWWTPASSAEFERRAQCVIDLYDSYQGVDGVSTSHVNGHLTLGENLADMGGVHVAYDALQAALAALDVDARRVYERNVRRVFDGATPEQLFFHSYAHVWCTKRRVESAYQALTSDPHAPTRWRVNGPLSQMDEFSLAFHCAPPPADACQVW